MNAQYGQALVCYRTREAAMRAQQALHMCQLGSTQIMAEYVSESDAALVTRSLGGGAGGAPPNAAGSQSNVSNLWG